jgi:hypothetical protein
VAFAGENVPLEHRRRPAPWHAYPAGHGPQTEAPKLVLYCPTGQLSQITVLMFGAYLPAAHRVQAEAPSFE